MDTKDTGPSMDAVEWWREYVKDLYPEALEEYHNNLAADLSPQVAATEALKEYE